MRYQAEPGNERIFIFLTPSQQSTVNSQQSTMILEKSIDTDVDKS